MGHCKFNARMNLVDFLDKAMEIFRRAFKDNENVIQESLVETDGEDGRDSAKLRICWSISAMNKSGQVQGISERRKDSDLSFDPPHPLCLIQ